jgi:hypothetical protein
MKTNPTTHTANVESLKYEPIVLTPVDATVRLSDFLNLISRLATQPAQGDLPVIA